VHQLVIKRFQHCLMHGVTMKFIISICSTVLAGLASQYSIQQISVLIVQTVLTFALITEHTIWVLQILRKLHWQRLISYINFTCFLLEVKNYKTSEPFNTVRRQICLSVAVHRQANWEGTVM